MATISASTNEKVYSINKWLGLNEHPDGDTNMKMGEASKMVNWRITRDGNLKRRPGQAFVAGLCNDYEISISTGVVLLASGLSATDVVSVYPNISAMSTPGKPVAYGGEGSIESGVFEGFDGIMSGGLISPGENTTASLSDGILTVSGANSSITIEDLLAELEELEEGEYLYTVYNEGVYALDMNSVTLTSSGTYTFAGYRVYAVPTDGEDHPIMGMWTGLAGGEEVFLAACDDSIWKIYIDDYGNFAREYIATVATDKGVNFIPFDNKVYIQNGYEYYVYDGTNLTAVEGYRPLVAIAIGPTTSSDAGELTGEYVNRLNGKRRVWISPDGSGKVFQLPETNLASIDYVLDLSTNTELVVSTDYSYDTAAGTVTFTSTPAASVNAYEIGYSATVNYRSQVTGMLYSEIFSGNTDSALFFYGDGTNKAIYTGMDYDGLPRADYFPDQYEVLVGDENTPITAMVRHYSILIAYKTDSAWALSYGTTELATGDTTVAIYVTPINRDKGNVAPGQVRLVDNNPVTCSGTELYHWINSSYYTSNLSRDERQAQRISDRVQESIKEIDFSTCCMWDDNDNQEFYISDANVTLVWNYAVDVWYRYEGLNAVMMRNFQGEVFIGTDDGKILRLTDDVNGDEGYAIEAEWESGAMDFGASHMRKYSSMMWVGLKPESGTSVDVCVITDRKNTFKEKNISSEKAKVSGQPFMVRSKIKAKKFVFYRLLLTVSEKMPPVTVTNVDFRVRQTGYSK